MTKKSNSYNNDDNFNIHLLDRCDDASIESLALTEMGSLAGPLTSMYTTSQSPQRSMTSSNRNTLQKHFAQSSVVSYADHDYDLDMEDDDVDDDNITYTTESNRYNDTDLTQLMMKLRGHGSGGAAAAASAARNEHIVEEEKDATFDDMVNVPDDHISKHLKALTITTLTVRKMDKNKKLILHPASDDISVMTYGTGLLDWGVENDDDDDDDDDDDESDDDDEDVDDNHTAYAEVDKVMHRLNSLIHNNSSNQEDSPNVGRDLLQQLSQQGACDYENAPHTASSKRAWLAQLAAELLQEGEFDNNTRFDHDHHESKSIDDDDDDDADVGSVAMSVVEIYNRNVRLLEKEAERAAQLLQKSSISPPLRSQTSKKYTSTKSLPSKHPTIKPLKSSLKQPFLDSSKRAETLTIVKKTAKDQELPQMQQTTNAKLCAKPSQMPSRTSPTSKTNATSRSSLSSSNVTQKQLVPEQSVRLKHHTPITKNTGNTKSKQYSNIVIPSGLPPYPGHGPKWPWHPDSPRAPDGYKECYMLHMGSYYHQYMTYLQQRALTNPTDRNVVMSTKNEEEVLRKALSSQATFKDHMSTTKPKSQPTSATTTPSKSSVPPKSSGRARKNCVVPVVLAKIDEGSNSSSKASLMNGETDVKQKTGLPDASIVGAVHPKSKGKRGTIVVVTANELDQKAKEERKVQRQLQQHQQQLHSAKKSVAAVARNGNVNTEKPIHNNANDDNQICAQQYTSPGKTTSTTEVDIINHCGCTIM
jgi:hypothetical protein